MNENGELCVKDGKICREEHGEHNCSACAEKGRTCIPFFVHENAMMHKDTDNERMHETVQKINEKNNKTVMTVCLTFIVIIVIFVTAYTVRTNIWLNTITRMNDTIVEMATQGRGAEVDHDVHQQPNR